MAVGGVPRILVRRRVARLTSPAHHPSGHGRPAPFDDGSVRLDVTTEVLPLGESFPSIFDLVDQLIM